MIALVQSAISIRGNSFYGLGDAWHPPLKSITMEKVLSIYVFLFEKGGHYYLYNSETGFLSEISECIYTSLYDGDFESIPDSVAKELQEKKIIVDRDKVYEYYYKDRIKYLSTIGNYKVLDLVIAPTTGCNFECPYCFEGDKRNHLMTESVISDLISFIKRYKDSEELSITWYGGEPLLSFNTIKRIVSRIKAECEIKLTSQAIVTNGYLINSEVINFMKENRFNSIQITFDGFKGNHNKTRFLKDCHQPTFDKILTNVDRLAAEMPEDFKIAIRVNINKKNEEDFPLMLKMMQSRYKGKNVLVYPGFIREDGKGNERMCYNTLFGKSRYEFYKKMADQGVNVDFFPAKNSKGCMACRNNAFIIGPKGELYKCWNDFNHPNKVIGNIKDYSLTNLVLISKYIFDSTIFNDPKCKECKLYPVCDGGCAWLRYKNLFEGKHYDLCTFMADNACLEECLLKAPCTNQEFMIKAY